MLIINISNKRQNLRVEHGDGKRYVERMRQWLFDGKEIARANPHDRRQREQADGRPVRQGVVAPEA